MKERFEKVKIIENNYKELNTNEQSYPIRYTCPYCDSVFEYEKSDIEYRQEWRPFGPEYEPAYDYINCPCCNREIVLKEYD